MKEQEVIEGNKMIAEFMGYKELDGNFLLPTNLYQFGGSNHREWAMMVDEKYWSLSPSNLRYDLSLDWLMPVIEKANRELPIIFEMSISLIPSASIVWCPKKDPHKYFKSEQGNDITPVVAIYGVVVDFLKWFNEQKK